MKDRIKESLSALCDDQSNELELRRILNHTANHDDLKDTWKHYQIIGDVMRQEFKNATTSDVMNLDLTSRIMAAIDAEDALEKSCSQVSSKNSALNSAQSVYESLKSNSGLNVNSDSSDQIRLDKSATKKKSLPFQQWMVTGSVAASVTMAVLLALQWNDSSLENSYSSMQASNNSAVKQVNLTAEQQETTIATNNTQLSQAELKEAQDILKQYVFEHSERVIQSGLAASPLARTANFDSTSDSMSGSEIKSFDSAIQR